MTPFEKAVELLTLFQQKSYKMGDYSSIYTPTAIHHAIICVDQIIESRKEDNSFDDLLFVKSEYHNPHPMHMSYWLKVKEELEKL